VHGENKFVQCSLFIACTCSVNVACAMQHALSRCKYSLYLSESELPRWVAHHAAHGAKNESHLGVWEA
jgi:hypothetical protein